MVSMAMGLALASCQTVDDASFVDALSVAPAARADRTGSRVRAGQGMALFANERAGKATVIEGTGRFVGEPPTGSLPPGGEAADGDVTVNLVDVPVAQAAKTILSDIFNVRYTIEPTIKGKMTIQTPTPVTREAAPTAMPTQASAKSAPRSRTAASAA
jgi:general secretion pathway protein D